MLLCRNRKFGRTDDNIWLSLIVPPPTATPFKKTSYLWDGIYRSTVDKWKPNITFSQKCASTVDFNRYWDTVSCKEKNNVICQKRNTSKMLYILTSFKINVIEFFLSYCIFFILIYIYS